MVLPHSGKCVFFVPTYIDLMMTVFLFTVVLVLFILPNIPFWAQCWDTLRKLKHGTEIVIGDSETSKQVLEKQIAQLLLHTLRKLLEWVISNGTTNTVSFFICNVYSSENRLHREKTTVVWSNFCFYSVQYCTVSVKNGKLTWILCYVFCFVMECNWTIRPLYFKNTLFFTSIYLYVSMYDVQKIKNKCLFFIFVTACLNIT